MRRRGDRKAPSEPAHGRGKRSRSPRRPGTEESAPGQPAAGQSGSGQSEAAYSPSGFHTDWQPSGQRVPYLPESPLDRSASDAAQPDQTGYQGRQPYPSEHPSSASLPGYSAGQHDPSQQSFPSRPAGQPYPGQDPQQAAYYQPAWPYPGGEGEYRDGRRRVLGRIRLSTLVSGLVGQIGRAHV